MRSGTKNAVVTIYRPTEVIDPKYNSASYNYLPWKSNVFTAASSHRGREQEVAGQIVAKEYFRFEFDYYDVFGIKQTDYIELDGGLFDIEAILPDLATKEYIRVDAVRRVPGTERA